MATKLYLHATTNDQSGTYPTGVRNGSPSNPYTLGTAATLKKMNTTIGASQTSVTGASAANSINQQSAFCGWWTSPPLNGAQTVGGGGNMTLNFACAESNTNMNLLSGGGNLDEVRVYVYVWRPSTNSAVGDVVTAGDKNTGLSEPASAGTETSENTSTALTTSAVNAQDGDVIVVELYMLHIQGMATSYNATFYFDGTTETTSSGTTVSNHASFIQLAETLSFQGGPPPPTTFIRDMIGGGIIPYLR